MMSTFLFRLPVLAAGAVALLCLGACGANHYSIYRYQSLADDRPSAMLIDAKQRAVISATAPASATSTASASGSVVVCAEPSPDVFSVLAQAASGTGSFGQSADPKSIQVAASLAFSSAEQGSTLARTQTINMLRESMYRTCERYMNGAIGNLEMPVQAVRDQRMMVATLAIEQLTAAATPRAVIIGAAGASAGGSSASDAVVKIANAQQTAAQAAATLKAKQAAYEALNKTDPTCDAIKTKVAAGTALTADETAKQTQCATAETDRATAGTENATAANNLDSLQKAVNQGGGGPASASTILQAQAEQGGALASADGLAKVADGVIEIVKANYDQDEVLLLCLKVLEPGSGQSDGDLSATCRKFVQARVSASQAQAEADQSKSIADKAVYDLQFSTATAALATVRDGLFGRFWLKVAAEDGKTVDRTKLIQTVDAYVKTNRPALSSRFEALKNQTTRDGLRTAFGKIATRDQEDLSK